VHEIPTYLFLVLHSVVSGAVPVWVSPRTLMPEGTVQSAIGTIPNARARNPNIFFSALAVETLLPASGNRSNYPHDFFVDTPRIAVDT
jgi:hypothetical protein